MNSLTTTKIYPLLDQVFNITAIFKNDNDKIKLYAVDRAEYDYLVQIAKTTKFDLTKYVVKDLELGNIKPVFFAEAKDNTKNKAIALPTSISSVLVPDRTQRGNVLAYFDVSVSGAKYIRNKTTNDIESFSMNERTFYGYAQRAFFSRFVYNHASSLDNNPLFVKTVATCYAKLFTMVITGQLGGNSKGDWMQRLSYIASIYALQNFFGYDMEKARKYALTFNMIDSSYIYENCKYWNYFNLSDHRLIDMNPETINSVYSNSKDKPKPIDVFVTILSKEFADMRREPMTYRTISYEFTRRYGPNSVLALEHAESFINMLLQVDVKSGLYSDLIIKNYLEPFIPIIVQTIQDICQRG